MDYLYYYLGPLLTSSHNQNFAISQNTKTYWARIAQTLPPLAYNLYKNQFKSCIQQCSLDGTTR